MAKTDEIKERGRGGARRSRAAAEAGRFPLTERLPDGHRSNSLRKLYAFAAQCSSGFGLATLSLTCFKASRRLSFSNHACRCPEPTYRPSAGAFSFLVCWLLGRI